MEGIVAKRTLKKSYYNRNLTLDSLMFQGGKEENNKNKSKFQSYKQKVVYKICIQSITMISIIAFLLAVKILNIEIVLESDLAKKVVEYYQTSYSITQISDGAKKVANTSYLFIKPIIPKTVEDKFKKIYKIIITNQEKDKMFQQLDNETYNNEVEIYEESSVNNKDNKIKENIGVSADVTEEKKETIAVSSSISSETNIVEEIRNTKIQFVKPVVGTITSSFGAREVIFEGIDSYHTGTDIAAKTGTKVVSSISGKVTRATYNKYNGNFVEVTNGKIATIYCHMSKLNVSVGTNVKAGSKIGEVGSTGLSTGPHLHFEIVYNGTKVNPELVLDL